MNFSYWTEKDYAIEYCDVIRIKHNIGRVVTLYLYFKIITAFKVYRIYVRIYKFNTWNLVWLKVPKDSFALVRIVVQRTFLCQ